MLFYNPKFDFNPAFQVGFKLILNNQNFNFFLKFLNFFNHSSLFKFKNLNTQHITVVCLQTHARKIGGKIFKGYLLKKGEIYGNRT